MNILGIQHHELLYIIEKYNDGNTFGSVAACILGTVKVYASLIAFYLLTVFCIISAFVANKDILQILRFYDISDYFTIQQVGQ